MNSTMVKTIRDAPVSSHETFAFYRSLLSFVPSMFVLFVVSVASIYIMIAYPASIQEIDILGYTFFLPLTALPIIIFAMIILHRLFDCKYIVGPRYVRCISGLLSFKKNDVTIELDHIRGIVIDRGLFGRVVNVGNLEIGTAAHGDAELIVRDIYNPSKLRDILIARRNSSSAFDDSRQLGRGED